MPGNIFVFQSTILDWETAGKIIATDFATIGNSPFVSYGPGKMCVVIKFTGLGDTQDLAIANENGNLITISITFQNQGLSGYLLPFDRWDTQNTFWAKAVPYAHGHGSFRLLVNAEGEE